MEDVKINDEANPSAGRKRKAIETIKIDMSIAGKCQKLLRERWIVNSCARAIKDKITSAGLEFSRSGAASSLILRTHVNDKFKIFIDDAIDKILTQGFFVYSIVPSDARSARLGYPVIVDEKYYNAKFEILQNFDKNVVIESKREDLKMNDRLHVFVFSYPTLEGVPTSIISPVALLLQKYDTLEDLDMYAHRVCSKPPILTRNKTDNTFDTRDILAGNVPGLRAQDENDTMALRNKINIAQYKQQHTLIEMLNRDRIDSMVMLDKNGFAGDAETNSTRENYLPRFIPLPNDAEVANFNMPIIRTDIIAQKKYYLEMVCATMGVPYNLITGTHSVTNRLQTSTEVIFHNTCTNIANALKPMLLKIYAQCFGREQAATDVAFVNLDRRFEKVKKEVGENETDDTGMGLMD